MCPGYSFGRPPVFLFGTLCPKVKARRVSVGPQIEGTARHDFGTTCPEVAGFGEAPQQAFLLAPTEHKKVSVATLPCLPLVKHFIHILVYSKRKNYNTIDLG